MLYLWEYCSQDYHQGNLCGRGSCKQLFQVCSGLYQNVLQTLRDRQNLHEIYERKAELAVRGEKLAQQKSHEAEADVEVKHWEKRNSDIAFCEINQEFESQLLQLQQANQLADQSQREKISLFGELEMRNRLFRENQANDSQEIEELRRICCEEADRARQARSDDDCESIVDSKFRIYRTKKIPCPCEMREKFAILKQRASLERPTFPVNPLHFRVPGPCLAAILDCRTIHGML